MRTIEWQDNGFDFEEETESNPVDAARDKEKMSEENDKHAYQIRKYQDPLKNIKRQELLALIGDFGALLSENNIEKIAIDLLTDDFEAFVFRSTAVQHQTRPQGFVDLWKGTSILERHVLSTDVDSDKSTAWQTCEYKTMYEGDSDVVIEVVCEVFSVIEKKIVKYRAFYEKPVPI